MESLQEIKQFLKITARLDLKAIAVTHILNLTGNEEGRKLIQNSPDIIENLISLTKDEMDIAKNAVLALVNLSAVEDLATLIINLKLTNKSKSVLIKTALDKIKDPNCAIADVWSMLICNLSRPESLINSVLEEIEEIDVEKLVTCFTRVGYNSENAHLNYLGPFFSNLTQCQKGRDLICNRKLNLLQRILPFINYKESELRRRGAIGVVKNICFDTSKMDWLLGPEVDILPNILFPLAGSEIFDEADNEMFPIELQFLDSEKKREDNCDLRIMLLETLSQLCATKNGREFLRSKGTYEILRELHKWEVNISKNQQTILACENVVDILIRTEDEIGEDNLKNVEIPVEMIEKIEYLNSSV